MKGVIEVSGSIMVRDPRQAVLDMARQVIGAKSQGVSESNVSEVVSALMEGVREEVARFTQEEERRIRQQMADDPLYEPPHGWYEREIVAEMGEE